MVSKRPGCEARQYSDQMQCGRCALAWDMNDPEPPECEPFDGRAEYEAPRYSASAEVVKHLRAQEATHAEKQEMLQRQRGQVKVTAAGVERKIETTKLPVTELDGPLLEMAFYGALKKAGIPGFAYRNMNSFLELDVVIEDYEAPADPPLAGQYVAARFGVIRCHGGSPFIAAARCFVKSVYGPEITVQMAG